MFGVGITQVVTVGVGKRNTDDVKLLSKTYKMDQVFPVQSPM